MNNITSKATTTEFSGGFQSGVDRSRKEGPSATSSKVVSQYNVSPMSDGESTVRPIQKGQTDIHYDKQPIPTIPASSSIALQPDTVKSNV